MKPAALAVLKESGLSLAMMAALCSWTVSQTVDVHAKPITDNDIQLMRQDLQSIKNQVITDTMGLNEKEAAAFWPIYKDYSAAQRSIADKRLGVISDYARNLDKMDDSGARSLTNRMFVIEDETQALRKEYFPRFEKALGAKRAAKFYQVDSRLTKMVDIQLASEIPLVP